MSLFFSTTSGFTSNFAIKEVKRNIRNVTNFIMFEITTIIFSIFICKNNK